MPADVVALARWTAEYYAAGAGEAITAVLPPKTRGDARRRAQDRRVAAITAAGLERSTRRARTRLRRRRADRRNSATRSSCSPARRPASPTPRARGARHRRRTRSRGWRSTGSSAVRQDRVDRDPFEAARVRGRRAADAGPASDRRAGERRSSGCARSPTTRRVPRRAAARRHRQRQDRDLPPARGRRPRRRAARVLMLVPEIALTPAVASLFRAGVRRPRGHPAQRPLRRRAARPVAAHPPRRRRRRRRHAVGGVRAARRRRPDRRRRGARRARTSRRRARATTAATSRSCAAQRAGALVVLGSATPSMESYHNAMAGKYERVVLERRVLDRPLAAVTVVDMREEYAAEGPDVDPEPRAARRRSSARLDARRAVAGPAEPPRLRDGGLLPPVRRHARLPELQRVAGRPRRRRGAAGALPLLQLLGARARRRVRCAPAPYLEQTGLRHRARRSRSAARVCPGARVARLDRDAVRRKGALAALLSRFRDGEIDVLVGTQMIAKGHDFPRVTLVGVDLGRRRPRHGRLPRVRADVSAADAGGRPRRPRRAAGRGDRPDAVSRPLQHPARVPAGLPGVLRARAAVPPGDALSAARVARQRRSCAARTFAGAMDDAADIVQRLRESDVEREGCPCSARRRRRSSCAASTARSCSSKEPTASGCGKRCDGGPSPELARRTAVDVDPLSVL